MSPGPCPQRRRRRQGVRAGLAGYLNQGGDAVTAALLIGSALQISAMAALALKVALIVILVRFALRLSQLVTAAGPTAGASLTAVPVVVGSARVAVRQAIRKIVDLLKRSALRLFTQASHLLRKLPSRSSAASPPPRRPPTPVRGPDNYLEAAADKSVNVREVTPTRCGAGSASRSTGLTTGRRTRCSIRDSTRGIRP